MSDSKLLIDTNVVIGLEDHHPVDAVLGELLRLCGKHGVHVFVDAAVSEDIQRDKNDIRRKITLSKLEKFEQLEGLVYPSDAELGLQFGAINSPNDRSDVRLLYALSRNAVDLLVTEDRDLQKRAERSDLGDRVLSVADVLEWVKQTFEPVRVELPFIGERKAYALDKDDPIFDSLREDYPGFDKWFQEKCVAKHRDVWTVEIGKELAGLIIYKDETHEEAQTKHNGPKILKLCTFKLKPEFRGEKFGEQLLKQVLWFCQRNGYDLVYVTSFPTQNALISLLLQYGFQITQERNGEFYLEKPLVHGKLDPGRGISALDLDRSVYPRFCDDENVRKFCVPIQGPYHRQLFPEISYERALPLFEGQRRLAGVRDINRTPGNTIRKVYLCRAPTNQLAPGDLLFFYMSNNELLEGSQCITTVGIVEQVSRSTSVDELLRLTARRSVYSVAEQTQIQSASQTPVKVIDFLLIGHSDPFVPLSDLLAHGIFCGHPPQSICQLTDAQYVNLKPLLALGYPI